MTLDQLCETIPDEKRAWLDREHSYLDGVEIHTAGGIDFLATAGRNKHWRDNGYLHLRDFFPAHLIDAYIAAYERDNSKNSRMGYMSGTPYMQVPEIKDLALYKPLTDILDGLIGEPMGLSLNLSHWLSSERAWHQDDYLNPAEVNGHYIAVWIALEDINPDSGPLEFVPGSHKWPVMRRDKLWESLTPEQQADPKWPRITQDIVHPLYDAEIEKRGAEVKSIDLKKGDAIIWHAWLVHRGGERKNPDLLRKSLICHYSGINHRPDMADAVLYQNGESEGYYFPF